MKNLLFLLFLIYFAPLKAQWANFDLQGLVTENFKKDVEPFIKSASISSANHLISPVRINNRLRIGASYSHGLNISNDNATNGLFGGYPNVAGSLLITDNLYLKGNFSIFNSNDDVVQSLAFGIGLNLTQRDTSNWHLSILFSKINGPDDISLNSIDANIYYNFYLGNLPLFVGLGTNNYKARILIDSDDIPNKIEGDVNYLILGLLCNRERLTVTPLISLNSDVIVMGLEFSGVIR